MRTSISTRKALLPRICVLAIAMIGLTVAVSLLISDSDPAPVNLGGGGEPPTDLVAIFDQIQAPPGATIDQQPVGTGRDLRASFWITGSAESVLDTYAGELARRGWASADSAADVVLSEKDDGSKLTGLVREFYRAQHRIVVTIVTTNKDPARGSAQMHVLLEPITPSDVR